MSIADLDKKRQIFLSKKQTILIIITLCIFFEPQIFKEDNYAFLTYIDYIYKALKIIASLYIFILYIKKNRTIKEHKVQKGDILIAACTLVLFLSTFLNNGDVIRCAGPALTMATMFYAAKLLIINGSLFDSLNACNKYFRIIFWINLVSILINDIFLKSKLYFLGIDNRFVFTYLTWMTFELLYDFGKNKKISPKTIIYFLLSELTLLYKMSYAAMIFYALFAILIVLPKIKFSKSIIVFFVSYITSNWLIIVDKISYNFSSFLISSGKDPTLSGRTFLWDGVIQAVEQKPLFGIGYQSESFDKQFFYESSGIHKLSFLRVNHAHNSIMTMLYRGGIVLLSLYLALITRCVIEIYKHRTNILSSILAISLIIFMCLSLFDTFDFSGIYFIMGICCALGHLVGEEKND